MHGCVYKIKELLYSLSHLTAHGDFQSMCRIYGINLAIVIGSAEESLKWMQKVCFKKVS